MLMAAKRGFDPDNPQAHDDVVLEYSGDALTRRWLHSASVDEPVGFEEYSNTSGVGSGTERAMFADRQGSVLWVTEPATGAVVAGYEYSGYGVPKQVQGVLSQPYGYTGREYDAESGLYHYRARAYDPAAGVFAQVDPIEFGSGTLALSSYTSNNPYNGVDHAGLTTINAVRTTAAELAMATSTMAVMVGAYTLVGDIVAQMGHIDIGSILGSNFRE